LLHYARARANHTSHVASMAYTAIVKTKEMAQTTGERERSEELAYVNFLWCFASVKNLIRSLIHCNHISTNNFERKKFPVPRYMVCFYTHTLCIQTQTLPNTVMVLVASFPGPSWGKALGRGYGTS